MSSLANSGVSRCKFNRAYIDVSKLYFYLFALCYLSGYYAPSLVPGLAIIILVWSYYLVVAKKFFDPIVLLILNARSIVGFLGEGNQVLYALSNILVNYLPFILAIALHEKKWIDKFPKYSLIYLLVLLVYMGVRLPDSMNVFGIRVLPMVMVLLYMLTLGRMVNLYSVLLCMRLIFICTLITLVDPAYVESSVELLQSGVIFGSPSDYVPLLGVAPRAMGPFWDPRILGVIASIYIVMVLNMKNSNSYRIIDIILGAIVVIATLSRGAIGTSLLILVVAPLLWGLRNIKSLKIIGLIAFISLILVMIYALFGDYLEGFIIINNENPFQQRSDFSVIAFKSFMANPMGMGLGAMRDTSANVGDASFNSVTDAFLMILLAEIGLLGFVIFLLSFFELSFGKNDKSKLLAIGLIVQMVGTDIPDFGVMYFALILLILQTARIKN
jgi:hypothetical protein